MTSSRSAFRVYTTSPWFHAPRVGERWALRGSHPSRRHSSVRLHSGDSLGTGAAERCVRGGSCAPNAMPPFRASLEASHRSPPHSARFTTISIVPFTPCVSSVPFYIPCASKARGGAERRRHEAEAVTAGDADGGKRGAADPVTGGIPTEPGGGRSRCIRQRRPAGIRRCRKCAGAKRRVAASEAKRPKGPQGATCAAETALAKLSADRMCWAGNAAAASRARLRRWDAWRWTRPRRQSGDCRAGRGRSQAPSATAGEVAAAFPAY